MVGAERAYCLLMSESLTLTAVFTPDENGWTMAQLAEWPAVVTCGKSLDEARAMLLDAAREMIASYREEGRGAADRCWAGGVDHDRSGCLMGVG